MVNKTEGFETVGLEFDKEATKKLTDADGKLVHSGSNSGISRLVYSDREGHSFVVLKGAAAQAGTESYFSGEKPTIHITAGIDDNSSEKQSFEYVTGYSSGFDAVVLPGRREDYVLKMPDMGDYPKAEAKNAWEGQPSLYGAAIVLEHVNGDNIILNGVEMVVFDHDNVLGQESKSVRNLFKEYEAQVKNEEVKGISFHPVARLFQELEAEMTPDEILRGKVAASREVAEYISKNPEALQEQQKIFNEYKDKVDPAAAYKAPDTKAFEENAPALGYKPASVPDAGPGMQ